MFYLAKFSLNQFDEPINKQFDFDSNDQVKPMQFEVSKNANKQFAQ